MKKTGVIFALVRDNKILMQQRDGNCKRFPFMWCIPGGAREDNEDYEVTLIREIKEEYSLDLSIDECTYLTNSTEGLDKLYICTVGKQQEPVLNEGLSMKWMNIEEIESLNLGFNQKDLIPFIKAHFNLVK